MFDPQSQNQLHEEIARSLLADRAVLDALRAEIRPLRHDVRRIQPRSATSISLVGTDGGNNSLRFDPFLVQIVRVVDSSNNEYCLEAITPTTDVDALTARQFASDGSPATPLGEMMAYLGVRSLTELTPFIRKNPQGAPTSHHWVRVYRDLMEWAILFSIVRNKDFATDTLVVFDGLLRSNHFTGDLFKRFRQGLTEGIDRQFERSRRRVYLAGVAKLSKVLERYRLVLALEGVLHTSYPAYVEIPRELEEKAYKDSKYARGDDREEATGKTNEAVAGKMFFVKFGSGTRDPIWPVDVYLPQLGDAPVILGHLLADAIDGFPVPFYPKCLQQAHRNAALVDFDFDILQDHIFDGIRRILGEEAPALDAFRLRDSNPAKARYT
ncbi:MAG: hypothetical protein V4671_12265 [Armatimonadota bacterium]